MSLKFSKFWPAQRWLGIFPLAGWRLRREVRPLKVVWWIEQDIPPYDHYRCAAHFVELFLAENQALVLTVRSRSGAERIPWPVSEKLDAALAQVAQQPPFLIGRWMGAAVD